MARLGDKGTSQKKDSGTKIRWAVLCREQGEPDPVACGVDWGIKTAVRGGHSRWCPGIERMVSPEEKINNTTGTNPADTKWSHSFPQKVLLIQVGG